ncbi:PDZ domain-containing protein 9-like [Heptranchias perlo]|uniref:PDZ domain-containing protein 9-like n=1 Tax=Heptranchias perlo TaxID=212740 RepID=UPI003559E638
MTNEDWNVRPVKEPGRDARESSGHNLGRSLRTLIKKDVKGLGLVLIEHGSFLQIVSIVEDGPGDRASNLKPGDILVKIGDTNVLGYKLRELRHLVAKIPMGTQLQLTVYRNYKDIPDNWKAWAESLHSIESVEFSSEEGETDWSSSSDDDDEDEGLRVKFKNFRPLSLFWHDLGTYLPPVSRTWHALKKNQSVLLVGRHIGCDILFHHAFEDGDIATDYEEEVPHLHPIWSAQSDTTSSTSSSSSPADLQWTHQLHAPARHPASHKAPRPAPEQPVKAESAQGEEEESTDSSADTDTHSTESSTSTNSKSSSRYSQTASSDTSTQPIETASATTTSTEGSVAKSSSTATTVSDTHFTPGK